MAGKNTVGEVNIEIGVDAADAKAALKGVQEELKDVGNTATSSGAKVDKAFDSSSSSIKRANESAQKFVGSITATVGAATGLIGVFSLLTGVFVGIGRSMIARAKETRDLADELSNLEDRIKLIDSTSLISQMDDLHFAEKQARDAIFETNASIEEKIRLTDLLEESVKNEKKAQRDNGNKEAAAEIKALDQAMRDLGQATRDAAVTDPIMKATLAFEEQQRAVDKLVDRRKELQASLFGTSFDPKTIAAFEKQARDAIDKNHATNLANIKKEVDEKARLEAERVQELADKQAAALATALDRELTKVFEGLNGIFGAEFTTDIGNLTGALKENAKAIKRSM